MLEQKTILSLYSESTIQNVTFALTKTDGLDVFGTPATFHRPFDEDLRERLWTINGQTIADENQIRQLDEDVTDFFISLLKEAFGIWSNEKVDYISMSGCFARLSVEDKNAIELGNLQKIANTFQIPVIGHFVQSDLNAGGTGSPLLSVFWQSMTKSLNKPLGIVGLGGVLKLTYIGPDGELGACDLGVGFALLEKWMARHSQQSQDEEGLLSARGQVDEKVLKVLMEHPFLAKKPPKAIHRNDFDELLEQVEGLSLEDGCATLTLFMIEQIISATNFFESPIEHWIFIGTGRKNPTLMLALQQRLKNVYIADETLPFCEHLNAIGHGFLGARCITGLPVSLPACTGAQTAAPCGTIVYPEE